MSTLGPEYVIGTASPMFSPNYPTPALFSCLACKTIRATTACPCGASGCGVCHLTACSLAAARNREDCAAWRRATDQLPEAFTTRSAETTVRRVTTRRVG